MLRKNQLEIQNLVNLTNEAAERETQFFTCFAYQLWKMIFTSEQANNFYANRRCHLKELMALTDAEVKKLLYMF